ncbi:lipocalin family protein [uncultured Tenacibaculum sp.]|uniref:lipocalin family protein n=1 Tax=uncultured Tenacibaculum sp. TaxID=174713 RepID=UPI0026182392|nr:lipocalin family protein [uncultured Tenacibaculum sp.]
MKLLSINLKTIALLLTTLIVFTSCNDDDETTPIDGNQNQSVFNELIGTWLIQKSSVNGVEVSAESFNCLKTSVIKFTERNYELNYNKKGTGAFAAGCAVTQQFSGTYEVNKEGVVDLNSNRGLTAELKEGKLIVTTVEGNTKQEDIFINEKDIVTSVLDTDDTSAGGNPTTGTPVETEEFKKLKEKLQGKWALNSFEINGESITLSSCRSGSLIEFKENNNEIFILQKKATFTQGDLNKYGIGIGGTGIKTIKVTKSTTSGNNKDKVTIDSNASCKFIKESTRIFEHVSDNTLKIKTRNIQFKLIDASTIELTFKNTSTNTEGKQIYKKM